MGDGLLFCERLEDKFNEACTHNEGQSDPIRYNIINGKHGYRAIRLVAAAVAPRIRLPSWAVLGGHQANGGGRTPLPYWFLRGRQTRKYAGTAWQ